MPLLDRAIGTLEPLSSRDPAIAATLVSAYEMRARARFGTGNRDGAMTDFKAVLAIDPGFTLAEGVSPRIVDLLDEVKTATLGAVELTLEPAAADLAVDGVRRKLQGNRLTMTGGSHTISASRPGYKPVEQSVFVNVGQTVPLTITLERVSSVISIITSPPGAEVVIDATPRGKTLSGPLPAGPRGGAATPRRACQSGLAAAGVERSDDRHVRCRVPSRMLRAAASYARDRRAARYRRRTGEARACDWDTRCRERTIGCHRQCRQRGSRHVAAHPRGRVRRSARRGIQRHEWPRRRACHRRPPDRRRKFTAASGRPSLSSPHPPRPPGPPIRASPSSARSPTPISCCSMRHPPTSSRTC